MKRIEIEIDETEKDPDYRDHLRQQFEGILDKILGPDKTAQVQYHIDGLVDCFAQWRSEGWNEEQILETVRQDHVAGFAKKHWPEIRDRGRIALEHLRERLKEEQEEQKRILEAQLAAVNLEEVANVLIASGELPFRWPSEIKQYFGFEGDFLKMVREAVEPIVRNMQAERLEIAAAVKTSPAAETQPTPYTKPIPDQPIIKVRDAEAEQKQVIADQIISDIRKEKANNDFIRRHSIRIKKAIHASVQLDGSMSRKEFNRHLIDAPHVTIHATEEDIGKMIQFLDGVVRFSE